MRRRGAGILMGAVLCAIGGGLSLVGSRQHGPGGPQVIYLGVVILGALRILLALIPRLRRSNRRPAAQPQAVATYATGAPYTTGAPYVSGAPYVPGAPYVSGAPYATGAPAQAQAPAAPASYTPVHSAPGRCWDCGSRVRLDAAICFHCGAAQVNAYQRATGRPARSATSGPAPAPTDDPPGMAEYPRYEPARPY